MTDDGHTGEDAAGLLIARRADLLERRGRGPLDVTSARRLEESTTELTELVRSGIPSLRRVDMDSDPELMRRLAPLEPVHPFVDPADVDEIRSRSDSWRHCYVLDNSALVGHPLNVVWVALMGHLPTTIDDIIGVGTRVDDHTEARVAVFYSIWNVEAGLAGIPGGSSLLDLVTDRLRHEHGSIQTCTTLSPVPGLRSWATAARPGWARETDGDEPDDLTELCVRYLLTVDDRGLPIDPVARFHMRNGARLWRLVPGADRSQLGRERSWGMMVNYRYVPEDLEANRSGLSDGRPALGGTVADLVDR